MAILHVLHNSYRRFCISSTCGAAALLLFGASAALPAQAEYQHLADESTMTAEQRELLDLDTARQYMLKIVNRDRASTGAPPVVLDLDVPTKVGQLHSDEMAINGYLSHWTMDGRKPDQRYSEALGRDAVAENAFTSLEGTAAEDSATPRKLDLSSSPVFHRYELDNIEGDFFNEKPPNDGHRVNIINPNHTHLGIGLSFASMFGAGVRTACVQEFVTKHADFGPICDKLVAGQKFFLTGKLQPGVKIKSLDLRWESLPKPMSVSELNKTSSYGIPEKVVASYFPAPDQEPNSITVTPKPDGDEISAQIVTEPDWQPGLYYLSVWAEVQPDKEETVISTRTFTLTNSDKSSELVPTSCASLNSHNLLTRRDDRN